jgi:signal transduction histidine kinase
MRHRSETTANRSVHSVVSDLACGLFLVAIYVAAGKFGLSLAFRNASASPIWPPTGIAFTAVLLWGYRFGWAIFIGAFLVNITTQGSLATSLAIGCGNTLEALLGAWLVARFIEPRRIFDKPRSILKFVVLGAVLSTAVSPSFGVTSLCLGQFTTWSEYGASWVTWWLGDLVSDLTIAPLVLIWAVEGWPRLMRTQQLEAAGMVLTVVLVNALIFEGASLFPDQNLPIDYLALLPLIWAAFRFGRRGAITAGIITSGIALVGTLHGRGPFVRTDLNSSLLLAQAFVATITLTALLLAAVVSEQRAIEAALRAELTERRKAEHALEKAKAELQAHAENLEKVVAERTAQLTESNAELEAFSFSLSHDLRAPLRAIRGFTLAVLEERRGDLGDSAAELERVVNSAKRMDRLIQDVLAFSRISRRQLATRTLDVEKLILTLTHERPDLQPPRAEIQIADHLPRIRGDEASLSQCVANLLDNAVKFVRPGLVPRVIIRSEPAGGRVRLWFEDNGIGIDQSQQSLIFDMFHRAHAGGQYEGSGIGLAIVRKAVERMGGAVGVQAEPGKGSRFWLELPKA